YTLDSTSGKVDVRFAQSKSVDYQEAIDAATTVRVIRPSQEVAAPYKNKVMQLVTPKTGSALSAVGDDGYYTVVL
ncbi:MAG: hypothetical protein ACRENP_17855, partial [Longimicrobiales bacterium]